MFLNVHIYATFSAEDGKKKKKRASGMMQIALLTFGLR